MTLRLRGEVQIPEHTVPGGFDHGDVHLPTGKVFIAHAASGTVEVVDGPRLKHLATIGDCPEASGVLASSEGTFIVAAARSTGHVLVIDPTTHSVVHKVHVGGRPNGLAWDSRRGRALVADVAGDLIAIIDPSSGKVAATGTLPGRSAWAGYERGLDRYLVSIRSHGVVVVIDPQSAQVVDTWPVSAEGPHGMDVDHAGRRVFIACEAGRLVFLNSETGRELGSVEIAGVPDVAWYAPAADQVYIAIGKPGVVQVVDARTMTVIETVDTGPGAHTLAFDAQRKELFVFRPSTCSVLAYTVDGA